MPQMAPIMWLSLFILILSLIMLMKYIIYFISNKNMVETNFKKPPFNINWSW